MYVSLSFRLLWWMDIFCPSTVLVWILMMRALRLEVLEALVEPRPPQPCLSCWTDFANVELAAMQEMKLAALSPCRFIKQPRPQLSDEEPRPSLSVQRTSRSLGRARASSSRPLRSCLVLPVLAPSVTLRHLLPPPQLEPNSPASTRAIPSPQFPRCHASPPWRLPSPLAIAHPPCLSQRRTLSSPFTLGLPLSSAPLRYQGGAFWAILLQKTEVKPLWVQRPSSSKTAAWLGITGEMTQPLTSFPPSGELSPPAAWLAQSEEAGGRWASTLGSCLLRAAAGKALKQSPPAQVDQEEVPRAGGLDAGLKGHREKDWRRRAVRGETWLQSWRSTWKRRLTEPDEVSAQRQLGLYFNHWGAPHSSSPHSGFVYIFTAAHYF